MQRVEWFRMVFGCRACNQLQFNARTLLNNNNSSQSTVLRGQYSLQTCEQLFSTGNNQNSLDEYESLVSYVREEIAGVRLSVRIHVISPFCLCNS